MMKQPDSGERHNHIVRIACVNHILVAFGAARLCDIFYAASDRAFDIIAEWEKCIRAECYV